MFEQDRFIVRLRQRVLSDGMIVGCWLGGSFGRNTDDPYSDIDIALVYPNDIARDEAWQQRRQFCTSILAYVQAKSFDAEHIRPYFHIALFSTGSKADFRFESRLQLRPNPWDGDIKIIKDSADNWVANYQAQCRQMAPALPRISGEELKAIDDRFWIMWWDTYRQVKRGKPAKAYADYMRMLSLTLPTFLSLLPPDHSAHQQLIDIRYHRDASITLPHLRTLLDTYLAARSAIVERGRVAFIPDGAFERNMMRLLAR